MPSLRFANPIAAKNSTGSLSAGMQRERHNPLVKVTFAVLGLLAVSLSRDILHFAYVTAVFLVLCLLLGLRLAPVGRSVRVMLPWMLVFFGIHLVFSSLAAPQTDLVGLLARESIVLFRFIGLAGVMGVLREGMDAQCLVDSIKTLMDRLHIRSRLAEDLLQTLRLILVFIPQVVREYRGLEQFNLALGFAPPGTLREKVGFYGGNLLPVMYRSLTRAHQLGQVMSLRGYGRVIPRGQLTPLPFRYRDGMAVVAITVSLGSSAWVF